MIKKWLALLPLIISFTGCSSPGYQPLGMGGGYRDTRLDSNTVRVTYYGNVAMPSETVQNYMLYRCAQVTLSYGYDYFIILSNNVSSQTSAVNTPGTMIAYNTNKNTSYGYFIPGQTFYTSRDTSSAMIKMYKGSKPANAGTAFNARDIIKYVGPQVKKSE
jgi:hypothetical protein